MDQCSWYRGRIFHTSGANPARIPTGSNAVRLWVLIFEKSGYHSTESAASSSICSSLIRFAVPPKTLGKLPVPTVCGNQACQIGINFCLGTGIVYGQLAKATWRPMFSALRIASVQFPCLKNSHRASAVRQHLNAAVFGQNQAVAWNTTIPIQLIDVGQISSALSDILSNFTCPSSK